MLLVLQDPDIRQRTLASWHWLAGSGACLAVHFASWVWSLEHTSLTHSLLFVCSSPVIIAIMHVVMLQPISKGEIGFTLLGFAGELH